MILISGLSSKAVRVLNSKDIFSDSCDNIHPNYRDDSCDPSSVPVLATEDKNTHQSPHSHCQGTARLEK